MMIWKQLQPADLVKLSDFSLFWLCVPDFHLVCRFPYYSFNTYTKKPDLLYYSALLYTRKTLPFLRSKTKKEQPIHILELFSYFRSPRSIDITVSCSFVLRLFHIPRTSFCFSVRFSELSS